LRHGPLRSRHDRLTGSPVEHEYVAALGRGQQRRSRSTAKLEIDEGWLRADIPVPHVVVHGLIDPSNPAGFRLERNNRRAEVLASWIAIAAPGIRLRNAGRQIS